MAGSAAREIPVVDLGDYKGAASAHERFVTTLGDALCDFGFVLVEGHGIEPHLIGRVYRGFDRFFAKPDPEKLECSGIAGGQRGFTPFGVEHAKDQVAPDLKEFFHVGQEGGEAFGYPANVWPNGDEKLRADALALFRALEACAARLLDALAEGFVLPGDALSPMIRDGNSILRALHYPPVQEGGPARSLRAAPHEDINLITLLCEATEAGLEIRPPGRDEWIPVPALPGRIVVDSGDMLSRLTNDVIPSTTHRVVNPRGSANVDRYSLPFFAHPRPECDLSVRPEFVSEARPVRHPPIRAGAFLEERLREIGLLS